MAVLSGDDFTVEVETAVAGTYVALGDMDNFDDGSEQSQNEFPIFGGTKYIIPGQRDVTATVSGFRNNADPGQVLLLAAEKARTPIKIRVKYDGTNGYTVSMKVKSRKGNAKPNGQLQTIAFDFIADAASVVVGTGPAI